MDNKGNNKSGLSNLRWVYKRGARDRDLTWELTNEQFAELTKQNCWYCDQEPAQIAHRKSKSGDYYLYNGIDRMDNTAGYTVNNCIPCCGRCNRMKNVLHAGDFIDHIRKITRNLNIF